MSLDTSKAPIIFGFSFGKGGIGLGVRSSADFTKYWTNFFDSKHHVIRNAYLRFNGRQIDENLLSQASPAGRRPATIINIIPRLRA